MKSWAWHPGMANGGVWSILIVFFCISGCDASDRERQLHRRGNLMHTLQTLIPPADLYDLLFKQRIGIHETGLVAKGTVKFKYRGRYSFGIFLDGGTVPLSTRFWLKEYPWKLKLKLKFFHGDRLMHELTSDDDLTPFGSSEGDGLILGTFEVPEEVPMRADVVCECEVVHGDPMLDKTYGPVHVYIKKFPEK